METYEGVEVQPHALSTSALDGGGQPYDTACYTLKERAPVSHWIGDLVSPRVGLDAVNKRKIPCPCRDSNPGLPSRNLVTILTELSRLRVTSIVNGNIKCVLSETLSFAFTSKYLVLFIILQWEYNGRKIVLLEANEYRPMNFFRVVFYPSSV
jgi:hypothetical protein